MSLHPIYGRFHVEVDGGSADALVVRLHGREQIGKCFELDVTAALDVEDGVHFDAAEMCGSRATLRLERVEDDGKPHTVRVMHGVVASVEDSLETWKGKRQLRFMFVPRLWQMSNVVLQEIFVGLTAPDVIRAKLEGAGMVEGTDFAMRLADPAAYRVADKGLGDVHADGAKWAALRPYGEPRLIVQYKESDLAFISRLAEHEGISFFFEHEGGVDRVVFADSGAGFTAGESMPFSAEGRHRSIRRLVRRTLAVPSTVYVLDYNYRAPDQQLTNEKGSLVFESLGAKAELSASSAGTIVELAPNVKNAAEAERIARIRAEELESRRERLLGSSDLAAIAPGLRFQVAGHGGLRDDEDDVVVVSVEHSLSRSEPGRAGYGEEAEYANTFEAVQAKKRGGGRRGAGGESFDVELRPPRITPKPRIFGLLTGVIRAAGQGDPVPTEQELARQDVDHEGRYIVRLHFDQGDSPMPRVRMAQPHAGTSYGMHFPLRPGAEVVVAFLDGDPDRPVIVGAVPHPLKASPVLRPGSDASPDALLHMNEMNRIETRSGIIIQIGDGDPGLLSVP